MKSYSVKQVSEILNTNPETVRRWIRNNKLHAEKTSNKGGNVILESALNAFINANPKYMTTSSLTTTALLGAALVGGAVATSKLLEASNLDNASVSSDSIIELLTADIKSYQRSIRKKQSSIETLQKEIIESENKIEELQQLISKLKVECNSKPLK